MNFTEKILTDIEIHSAKGIKECFENGVNPNGIHDGRPLFDLLVTMYLRGSRFKECVQTFVDYGLRYDDRLLLALLMDDDDLLDQMLTDDRELLHKKYTLACAFTPLHKAGLLHICAEYNHLACAKILVKHGADVNGKAGIDQYGFGGQTPVFHTVNQHNNACLDVLKFLLEQSADLTYTVKGLLWGKGYEWETFIPAVNPISYAMMGLLRQFQRTEKQIYEVVTLLLKASYGIDYEPENVPNRYLIS